MHEGMTWGAVARKRTTAIGLDEKTLSDQPRVCLFTAERIPTTSDNDDPQNEAAGFGAECTFGIEKDKNENSGETA